MSATISSPPDNLKRKSPDGVLEQPPAHRPFATPPPSVAVASLLAQQTAYVNYSSVLPTAPNQTVPPPQQLPSIHSPDANQDDSNGGGDSASDSKGGRALSSSKRAEQNRKAQRAFRERRDQHVKDLESRSQMLDQALHTADEANRRWDETRNLLDEKTLLLTQTEATLKETTRQLETSRTYVGDLKALLSQHNIPIPESRGT